MFDGSLSPAPLPSDRKGLAVLLPPQRFQEVHMRLALLSMSGSDLTLDLLFQLRVESSRLDVLQLNLGSKVDVAKRQS